MRNMKAGVIRCLNDTDNCRQKSENVARVDRRDRRYHETKADEKLAEHGCVLSQLRFAETTVNINVTGLSLSFSSDSAILLLYVASDSFLCNVCTGQAAAMPTASF